MKKCCKCKEVKSLDQFGNLHCTKDKKAYCCYECAAKYTKYYKDKNRDLYNTNQKLARQTEDVFIKQLLHGAKTRAKKKVLEFNLSFDFIKNLLHKIEFKCQITNETMTLESKSYKGRNSHKVSLDRIDSQRGYVEDNVQLICWAVNQIKNDYAEEDFKFWINTIHKAISSQA